MDESWKDEIKTDSDKIKNFENENDKLKKDLRIIKKSLKETLDLNDAFSRDLQKMKHKSFYVFMLFYLYLFRYS